MVELGLTGRTLAGYRVGELLGRGAFGWVYQARQLSLDRTVALKVLDPVVARNPDAARRFDREGRSAASLDHPAIVDVYQAGESDGLHFLAMRIVEGVALDVVLQRGPMLPAELIAMLRRIGPALDHAHDRGVVHRDVKPANILLEHGNPRRAWLGDFGIAVSVRVPGEMSTATIGTAYYMAPEQVEPSRVGPASDQYSLGCVAYEALTGRRPFPGDDVMAVLMSHRVDPLPPTGSPALDSVLGKALAKHPSQRYATVTAFVQAVGDALRAPAGGVVRPSRVRWVAWFGVAGLVVAAAVTAATLLPDDAQPHTPTGWVTVDAPGPARYSVPPDWQGSGTGPVRSYTMSGAQALTVGTEAVGGDLDPSADLARLYSCTGVTRTHELPAGHAASCQANGRQATVVAAGGTAVRFTFADAVPAEDRDKVLASLTVTG